MARISIEEGRRRDRERHRIIRKKMPYYVAFVLAKQRCLNPKNPKYYRYGGRGIKFNITLDDIKALWFRDKAYLMKWPSIDRKDNDGDYTFENCRFIEFSQNSRGQDRIRDYHGRFMKSN